MRSTLVLGFGVALAAAIALVASATGGAATAACKPGMTTFGGASARVFCGPARATFHAGGKTFTIRNGRCRKTAGALSVDFGEIVLGSTTKPRPEYAGLAVGREVVGAGPAAGKDGVYHTGLVALRHAGKGYPLRANATITLSHGRSRGTFAATSLSGGAVTGSFHC